MKYVFALLIFFLSIARSASAFECERPSSQNDIEAYKTIFWGEVISGPLSSVQFVEIFTDLDKPDTRQFYERWKDYKKLVGNSYIMRVKNSYAGQLNAGDIAVVELSDLSSFLEEDCYLLFSREESSEFKLNDCHAVPLTKSNVDYLKGNGDRLTFDELKNYGLLPGYRLVGEP